MKKQLLSTALILMSYYIFGQIPISERNALIDFYNSTDGVNWYDSTNWNTSAPASTWCGVTVENISGIDHVTELNFPISNNNLNGFITPEIGNLTELIVLEFRDNPLLTGEIPVEIGNLTKLEKLIIDFNSLTGEIPVEIGNLTKLEMLDLGFNSLTGELPVELGNLSNLITLDLWSNNFTGVLIPEIGNCTNLKYFFIEYNQITGSIPIEYSNLTLLKYFYIDGNTITGDVPDIFSNMPDLRTVSLIDNQLTGTVDLSNNSKVTWAIFKNNNISTINFKNGNNINMPSNGFLATNNPNLTCIFVDDAIYSATNWIYIDETATFVETEAECNALSINDDIFEQTIELYPNPTSGILHIENKKNILIERITILNTLGQIVFENKDINNINISNLPNGIYHIKLENTDGNTSSYKILKD